VIQDRDYVNKEKKRLIPTETGRKVIDLLVEFFPEIMDYSFTARMEDKLDDIAEGQIDWRPMLDEFYNPFEQRLQNAEQNMPTLKQEVYAGRKCPTCGTGDLLIKNGKYGKFIGCSNYPECKHTERYLELTGVPCPQCGETEGGELARLQTKRGRTFYGCSRYPDCDYKAWKLPEEQGKSGEVEAEADLERDAS
jgi:DNA topoisomerase-1